MSVILISTDDQSIEVPIDLASKSKVIERKISETWTKPGIPKQIPMELPIGSIEYIFELLQIPPDNLPYKLQTDNQTLCSLMDILQIANYYVISELIDGITKTISLYLTDPQFQTFEITQIRKELSRGFVIYEVKKLDIKELESSISMISDLSSTSCSKLEQILQKTSVLLKNPQLSENLNRKISGIYQNFDIALEKFQISAVHIIIILMHTFKCIDEQITAELTRQRSMLFPSTFDDSTSLIMKNLISLYDIHKNLPPREFLNILHQNDIIKYTQDDENKTHIVDYSLLGKSIETFTGEKKDYIMGLTPIKYSDKLPTLDLAGIM